MATGYNLRSKDPRKDTMLYELEILEDVYTNRVKVHYIGYDNDEWRDKAEIVTLKHKMEPGSVGRLLAIVHDLTL